MRTKRTAVIVLLALLLNALTIGSSEVQAKRKVIVDDDGMARGNSCNNKKPTFSRIGDAISAAGDGVEIVVCPGTYREQVTIPYGKDGITLRARKPYATVLKAPGQSVGSGSIIHVAGARDVTIRGFIITGPLADPAVCSLVAQAGVRVDNGGTARIINNLITGIRSTSAGARSCQNGYGVLAGDPATDLPGSAEIVGNVIERYQRAGILVTNAGSVAEITANVVQGAGPTPVIAQRGVHILNGGYAEVVHNYVADNTFTRAPEDSGAGILLERASVGTFAKYNNVVRNDDNIALLDTDQAFLKGNRTTDATFFDGIFVDEDSIDNFITENYLRRNAEHDCHDDSVGPDTAGTENIWIDNDALTENREGLCLDDSTGDDDGGDDDEDDEDDDKDGKGVERRERRPE